ncbi:hypothetical protein F5Y16DRAFT_370871 [Xylariaceae sp. FL0255]|nr:hypothetical protein F5Y16DRAFT_370871 [Xylariaceae sp. FL0255]
MSGSSSGKPQSACGIVWCAAHQESRGDDDVSYGVYSTSPDPFGEYPQTLHLHDKDGYCAYDETACSSWIIIKHNQHARTDYFFLTGQIRLQDWKKGQEKRAALSTEAPFNSNRCKQIGAIPSYRLLTHDGRWLFDPRIELVHIHKPDSMEQAQFEQKMNAARTYTLKELQGQALQEQALKDYYVNQSFKEEPDRFQIRIKGVEIPLATLTEAGKESITSTYDDQGFMKSIHQSGKYNGSLLTFTESGPRAQKDKVTDSISDGQEEKATVSKPAAQKERIMGIVSVVGINSMTIRPMYSLLKELYDRLAFLNTGWRSAEFKTFRDRKERNFGFGLEDIE